MAPHAAASPAAVPPVAPLDWEDDRRSSMALRTPSDYDGLLAPNSIGRRVTVVARGTGFPVAVDGAHERLRRRQMDAKLNAAAAARQSSSPVAAAAVPPSGLALSPSSMTPWAAADAWPEAATVAAAVSPPPPSPECTSPSASAMTGSSLTASPTSSTPPSPTVASRWPSRRSAALGGGGEELPPAPSDRRVSLPGDLIRRPFSTSTRPTSARTPSSPAADEWFDDYVSFASEVMLRSAAPARGRLTTVSGRTASSMAMSVRRRRSIWGRRRRVEVAL